MKNTVELLAPGGDIDSIKAAIAAGANAVYCGLDKFNARNRATNLIFDDLNGILHLAHQHQCQVFLTLNIIIVESELPAVISLLNKLINTSIDGVIVQDFGLLYLLSRYFKGLKIHASTQLTTHNEGQILFLSKLQATRVNLSRELNIREIEALTAVAHRNNLLTEVFVHGSNCICFSGICYISSVHGGNSGNRGRCSQPCRDQYQTTTAGKNFPLNLKDNSAFSNVQELSIAGVDSLKIEGRIKKFDYVYTVVDEWRKQLQRFYHHEELPANHDALYKVFNRDFTNAFLRGDINKGMFIDSPRDHSIKHLSETNTFASSEEFEQAQLALYSEKEEIVTKVKNIIDQLSTSKAPLTINVSGTVGTPLKVLVKTPEATFEVLSESNLSAVGTEAVSYEMVLKRLKALNDTEYYIEQLDLTDLQPKVFISFKELTSIKKRLLFFLNHSRDFEDPITIPWPEMNKKTNGMPSLSVFISSPKDLALCNETSADIYFQLPSCFSNQMDTLIDLFLKNRQITPSFPSVLIGADYIAAVEFLIRVTPLRIVTNNTGIAYQAYEMGIAWIAGPHLNIANSFSLLCLKEHFNCCGAFISNELSKIQIQRIKKPEAFELYYSIYHPIQLMTSRQCLFQQVVGCKKDTMDDTCIEHCNQMASISNLKGDTFFIEKAKGNYHAVYNEINFLNTQITTDMPDLFTGFSIDLRDIQTKTKVEGNKTQIVSLFENLLSAKPGAKEGLEQSISSFTNHQYLKGI